MFFFFFDPELKEALKTNEGFIGILKNDVRSRKMKRLKPKRGVSHPEIDKLYDYILGNLSSEEMGSVMEHMLSCEECAEKMLEIRRLDKKVVKELQAWVRTSGKVHAKGSAEKRGKPRPKD